MKAFGIFYKEGFVISMSGRHQPNSPVITELVRKAQTGDDAAFAELYARYYGLIESRCRSFLSANQLSVDLEELQSEAALALWKAVLNYNLNSEDVTFGLYAQVCITNQLISYFRKHKQMNCVVQMDTDQMAEIPAGEESNPARRVMEQEQYAVLQGLMERVLSKGEQEVWFRFVAGRTAAEIAEELCLDKRSVENAIFRARRKLRRAIPPHC